MVGNANAHVMSADYGVEAKPCGYPTLDGKLN